MPSIPTQGGDGNEDVEFMRNVAFLIKESGMSYFEVMKLPYQIFISLTKHFNIMKLESTEEGRQYLSDCKRYNTTEADYDAIRKLKGYKAT